MTHWKCVSCHHEWDGGKYRTVCDWCGSSGEVLSESKPAPIVKMAELLTMRPSKQTKH